MLPKRKDEDDLTVGLWLMAADAVFLSRPDKSGCARISGHLGKIVRKRLDFCDLVHIQSVIELFAKRKKTL